jgi:hypothetical protein
MGTQLATVAMGQPWDESMDEHGTIFQTMDEHET